MSKANEVVIYDQNKFVEIFTEKTGDSFIEKLEKEVADFQKTSDMSSEEGKKAIRSYSYELSQHKAPLKKAKLEITEKVRSTITALNSEENRLLDRIQELQDEVRKPLTDFEEKEKEHIEIRQKRIEEIEQLKIYITPSVRDSIQIETALKELDDLIKFDWQLFQGKAENCYNERKTFLKSELKRIEKREEEQAEIKAKEKQEEAIRLERARAEAVRQKEIDEAKVREADLEHRTKIYNEMINALFPYVSKEMGANSKTKAIIAGIAKGKIPYISIKF